MGKAVTWARFSPETTSWTYSAPLAAYRLRSPRARLPYNSLPISSTTGTFSITQHRPQLRADSQFLSYAFQPRAGIAAFTSCGYQQASSQVRGAATQELMLFGGPARPARPYYTAGRHAGSLRLRAWCWYGRGPSNLSGYPGLRACILHILPVAAIPTTKTVHADALFEFEDAACNHDSA